jgi:hypothetical protein
LVLVVNVLDVLVADAARMSVTLSLLLLFCCELGASHLESHCLSFSLLRDRVFHRPSLCRSLRLLFLLAMLSSLDQCLSET